MIEEIIKLREDGLSFRKIASELNTTVGKVQYRWNKWAANQESLPHPKKEQKETKLNDKDLVKEVVQVKGGMQAKLTSPKRILLFWEVSEIPKKLIKHHFNKRFEEQVQVIRIFDVTDIYFSGDNAHHFYEIAVPYQNGYWFVKGLTASRSYVAEFGVKINENHYFPIFRSNSVDIPSLSHSEENGLQFELTHSHQVEQSSPKWIEHVSTYTYYDTSKMLKQDDKP